MTREVLQQALEAMEGADQIDCDMQEAINAIKEALAQPEWVGLTDTEIKRIGALDVDSNYFGLWYDFAKAIEAKLKEKNT
jgi:putative methionine-R-sulfoxide reductase with GAF domain|tara:strand:+ start:48 stop:287 length:240 start_codon:yes stop_codon:yes gene_type:complete